VVSLGLYLGLTGVIFFGQGHEDPAWFIHLSRQFPPVALARRVLGPKVIVPPTEGHDGRFFWLLARDPLLLHPQVDLANMDRPAYRSQRIGYPLLVAPWRVFGEYGVVWGLLVTNLALVAVGAAVTASLATDLGAPARAGLAFALNPAVVTAVAFDFADILAIAGVLTTLWLFHRRRYTAALAVATVAVLTKEICLLPFVAVAALTPGLSLNLRARLAVVPVVPAALWAIYMRWRLSWPPSRIQEFTFTPFYGYLDAYRRGWSVFGNWIDMAVALVAIALAVVVVVTWWRRRTLLLTAALPYALLVPFLSAEVLAARINCVRALGPVITLLVLEMYASPVAARRPSRGRPTAKAVIPLPAIPVEGP
jgi:hypothetical protein